MRHHDVERHAAHRVRLRRQASSVEAKTVGPARLLLLSRSRAISSMQLRHQASANVVKRILVSLHLCLSKGFLSLRLLIVGVISGDPKEGSKRFCTDLTGYLTG